MATYLRTGHVLPRAETIMKSESATVFTCNPRPRCASSTPVSSPRYQKPKDTNTKTDQTSVRPLPQDHSCYTKPCGQVPTRKTVETSFLFKDNLIDNFRLNRVDSRQAASLWHMQKSPLSPGPPNPAIPANLNTENGPWVRNAHHFCRSFAPGHWVVPTDNLQSLNTTLVFHHFLKNHVNATGHLS